MVTKQQLKSTKKYLNEKNKELKGFVKQLNEKYTWNLNPIQNGSIWVSHGWGGAKNLPSLKFGTFILYLYLYFTCAYFLLYLMHPLSSADIIIFHL